AASAAAEPHAAAPRGAAALAAAALSINKQAQAAIGQPDLLSSILNQPADNTLFYPYDVARDRSVAQTRLYVADTLNTRILGFECSGAACTPATFASASRVFGQADFADFHQNGGLLGAVSATTMNFPHGVAVDAAGTLYVADTGNNRVLIFQNAWNDNVADIVLGQASMSGAGAGSGLSQLRAPEGVFVDDGGAVWVADTGNNRVLKFTTLSTGASAAFAIGGGGGASATTLSGPRDVHVDGSGNLWVADTGFSRVLRYAPPLTAGKAASGVLGQPTLTSGTANQGGLGATSLGFPEKLFADDNGRLWVADSANNRVLEYDTPLTSATASRVYGQADRSQNPTFTSNLHDAPDGFPNAAGVWGPRGLTLDANGTLWVCDRDNSRLLGFLAPLSGNASNAVTADRVLGKPNFVDAAGNQPTARRTNNPTAVAIDRRSPNRLWMADYGNNRILGFNSTADLTSDRAADKVLGQTSFTVAPTNAGINGALQNAVNAVASNASFFFPHGVAVDSQGGVYVADGSNSRVLRFADPWAGDALADTAFGQTNFSNRNPSFPWGAANSLAGPNGVAVGPGDDLWVADTLDHRVVRFANAPAASTGASANLVLGQSSFVSSSSFPPYSPGCSATRMDAPLGVHAAASGRVYVADSANHRVLVFTPPFSSGMSATAVFGQANFTSCNANRGGAAGAATLNDPRGVYEDDGGNVFIADAGNHRVLVYYTPFNGGDLIADDVVGQSSLTGVAATAPRPDSLTMPSDVTMDGGNRLFVADREHSRVTRYAVNAAPSVQLDPLPNPVRVGQFVALTGSGFTAGSVVQIFVATASGAVTYGPYTPDSWSSGILYVYLQPSIGLGNGYATFMVINTDQGYITSNTQSQLLYGSASLNLPTISHIDGVALRGADPTIPVANVETVVGQGQTVTITGDGFNSPLVNLYTANGNMGPLAPVGGWTSTQFQVVVPANTPTGPGSFQVVNNPYTGNVLSNAVSVPIGARLTITAIAQSGNTVTVDGTGFSTLSVINLFAQKAGGGVDNFGGFGAGGPNVPLSILSSTRFTFTVPAGAASGPAYVMVLNPPFIPYASSGAGPSGGFTMTVAP
ncbi:MAG: NHL repeat-containing protein, partial [Deltaproteobacteria bacterium]|nr:NHL repeat-containing protein [Deltaproteobacteria bacterium]